jgi:GAF domain-containing protein
MHQLHFMPDLAAGAEYVLHALQRVVPSEGALVHVFDINARQFVVVRAAGPHAGELLLLRTPDTFPLFRDALRRSRSIVFREIPEDDRYRGGRFEALGVHVKLALCGPVQLGGRYLGIVELVNPLGGTAFHEGEVNAIDYICHQFAEFVASRPMVLDADAVVPKA